MLGGDRLLGRLGLSASNASPPAGLGWLGLILRRGLRGPLGRPRRTGVDRGLMLGGDRLLGRLGVSLELRATSRQGRPARRRARPGGGPARRRPSRPLPASPRSGRPPFVGGLLGLQAGLPARPSARRGRAHRQPRPARRGPAPRRAAPTHRPGPARPAAGLRRCPAVRAAIARSPSAIWASSCPIVIDRSTTASSRISRAFIADWRNVSSSGFPACGSTATACRGLVIPAASRYDAAIPARRS